MCSPAGKQRTGRDAAEHIRADFEELPEIVAAGHRVELHCHRPRNQLRLTPRAIVDDAERAQAAIEDATGQAIADYRPPYGIFSGAGLAAVVIRCFHAGAWHRSATRV